ncbi:SRPBCC domain-containing protein [Chitinophaga sedimenti]|uniref:SRPBCC family protein n=1 Tax=Chitinophaga sedimenti TaxID=2033606 RepID=UPI002002FAF3|nr:SRPBCC domain-containing protein [Chitinophaga sedimenti]MCK7556068.1 SRPBCC domain-containing protein [Chitinophaga sedimenti]
MEHAPFVIERTYDHPVAKVWKALTDKAQMKQWYFDVPDFAPVVGQEFSFIGNDGDLRFNHLCRVTAVEEQKKIAYTGHMKGMRAVLCSRSNCLMKGAKPA